MSTEEIPGRCVKFIMCIVKGGTEQVPLEGLIEPSESGSISKHLMVGRSLNKFHSGKMLRFQC